MFSSQQQQEERRGFARGSRFCAQVLGGCILPWLPPICFFLPCFPTLRGADPSHHILLLCRSSSQSGPETPKRKLKQAFPPLLKKQKQTKGQKPNPQILTVPYSLSSFCLNASVCGGLRFKMRKWAVAFVCVFGQLPLDTHNLESREIVLSWHAGESDFLNMKLG